MPWFEYYFRWKELCGNTFISPVLWPRVSSWISNSLLMISTAENPWPLITFNLRKGKKWGRGRGETYWREIKKNILFFSSWPCVWEGYYLCLAVRESKGPAGTLTHIFWFEFLVTASNGRLLQLVNNRADHLLILQPQLLVDDLHIPHWVHCTLNMDDILILKSTCSDRTQTQRENQYRIFFFLLLEQILFFTWAYKVQATESMSLTFWDRLWNGD